jgi:hypothetical protein
MYSANTATFATRKTMDSLGFRITIPGRSKNLVKEWETREDLDRHIRSERFGVLLRTKNLIAEPLEMKIHTVSHSEGAEAVNALRGKGTSKKTSKKKENISALGQ